MSKDDSLLNVLMRQTTVSQIHALLKEYKKIGDNKNSIYLTGSKEDLIKNLINAAHSNLIPLTRIYGLIRESEEYGDQYIYLFKLKEDKKKDYYSNSNKFKNIWIKKEEQKKLPKIMDIPKSLTWADFRSPDRGVTDSWIAKLYDKAEIKVLSKDKSGPDPVTNSYIDYFDIVDTRVLYIIYWNGKNTLEYRFSIKTYDSKRDVQSSYDIIDEKSRLALEMNQDFEELNLDNAINTMLVNYEKNKHIYQLSRSGFRDENKGFTYIKPYRSEREGLLSDPTRSAAVNAILENAGSGEGLVVKFLADGSNGDLDKDLNVILGRDAKNQIIISSKIKPKEYSYVRRTIEGYNQ